MTGGSASRLNTRNIEGNWDPNVARISRRRSLRISGESIGRAEPFRSSGGVAAEERVAKKAQPLKLFRNKKSSADRSAELFSLRRPDVCFRVEQAEREVNLEIAPIGLDPCYFFATPTRFAAGLGTKDYPRVHFGRTLRPRFSDKSLKIGSPAPSHDETTSVINFSTMEY